MNIKDIIIPLLCSFVMLLGCSGCDTGSDKLPERLSAYDSPKYQVDLHSAGEAAEYFTSAVISLKQSRTCHCVSPVFVKNLPDDIAKMESTARKQLFISIMLPVIARENLRIQHERQRIITLKEKIKRYKRLFWHEQAFLNRMCAIYGVKNRNFDKLLKRVDVIPTSLALAQAIIESGWGTSRFALQGNSLYGVHWPPNSKKKYLTSKIGKIKVAAYDSIGASTRHYLQLLNSASAYDGLRTRRLRMTKTDQSVSGTQLAAALSGYSEIGKKYVEALERVINTYQLEELNTVQFRENQGTVFLSFN